MTKGCITKPGKSLAGNMPGTGNHAYWRYSMQLFHLLMMQGEHCTLLACGFQFRHERLSPGFRADLLDIVRRMNGYPTQIFRM